MQSKYCYKGTDTLINKLDIKDEKTLNEAEAAITAIRQIELEVNPIKGNYDLKHLQKIHRYIFKDLYDFAGKLRAENIEKGFTFANAQFIEPEANKLFKELRNENFLLGKNLDDFSDRAAYYMAEINVLHPFREGNGRTNREFIRELSGRCGYKLDWNRVPTQDLFNASVKSIVNTKPLAELIKVSIENKEPLKNITKMFQKGSETDRDR